MNGTDSVSSVPALVPRNLVDGVVDGQNVDAKMWPQVVEGKKYVAMIDVFRPVGVDATVQWDTENGLVAYQRAAKNGEWERIVTIWDWPTPAATAICVLSMSAWTAVSVSSLISTSFSTTSTLQSTKRV